MKKINTAFKEIVERELNDGVFQEVVDMRRHIHMHPCVGIFTRDGEICSGEAGCLGNRDAGDEDRRTGRDPGEVP